MKMIQLLQNKTNYQYKQTKMSIPVQLNLMTTSISKSKHLQTNMHEMLGIFNETGIYFRLIFTLNFLRKPGYYP